MWIFELSAQEGPNTVLQHDRGVMNNNPYGPRLYSEHLYSELIGYPYNLVQKEDLI